MIFAGFISMKNAFLLKQMVFSSKFTWICEELIGFIKKIAQIRQMSINFDRNVDIKKAFLHFYINEIINNGDKSKLSRGKGS